MPAHRTNLSRLGKLLELTVTPVYVVDRQRKIVFANAAVAVWQGVDVAELVGQECRYHSQADDRTVTPPAARLCPPPETFSGQAARASVSANDGGQTPLERTVEFSPLFTAEGGVEAVMAMAVPAMHELAANDDRAVLAAGEYHSILDRFRRAAHATHRIDRLVGDSAQARRLRQQVALAAAGMASVLIVGRPGSGRQHVAKTIHYGRGLAGIGPLVPLACPLLGPELLQSSIRALARAQSPDARPGTLLLNDVDRLPAAAQAELAGFMRHGELPFRLIGTARESMSKLAAQGRIDPTVSQGMETLVIELPRLSQRLEDLPLLAQWFVEEANAAGAKQLSGFSVEAIEQLAAHRWTEEIDELAAIVREAHDRAVGPTINRSDLPERVTRSNEAAARPRKRDESIVLDEFLQRIERELIERALSRSKGNKAKASRLLGMTRPRLYRRLVQLGLAAAALDADDMPNAAEGLEFDPPERNESQAQ